MTSKQEITWFKNEFAFGIKPVLTGTPLTVDLICAIAYQETGYIWSRLRKSLPHGDVLRLCVGDTIDSPRRGAFPRNKAALTAWPRGDEMFELARALLIEMANKTGDQGYLAATAKPAKFVRGYGIFQYDLQFFKKDPDFFLEQRWQDIAVCVEKLMGELRQALRQLKYHNKTSLTERELANVAIVYNAGFGNFDEARGLRQGHPDSDGVYYGEHIANYLSIAKAVPMPIPAVATMGIRRVRAAASPAEGLPSSRRARAAAREGQPAVFYPHWATPGGSLDDDILDALPAGTIIGFHHHDLDLDKIAAILRWPGKSFKAAWYVESNLREPSERELGLDENTSIAERIKEVKSKQRALISQHGLDASSFSGLIELDAAREKFDGFEPEFAIQGNLPDDAIADAKAVKTAGFKYLGKNLSEEFLDAILRACGVDFVPRIVIEDVTGEPDDDNPGYREDARALAGRNMPITLIIHEESLGEFPGADEARAREVLAEDFAKPHIEAIHGLSNGFKLLQRFGEAGVTPVAGLTPTLRVTASAGAMPATAATSRSVVEVARDELARFGGVDEGDEPLYSRIREYFVAGGGSSSLSPTSVAWSAAFVSYCFREAGATPAQFKFSLAHSVFVHQAIKNADDQSGVFRAHRIADYAPKPGDIIHHNRGGSTYSYDFARANSQYLSHSAIVVDFDIRDGKRGVVTIGGNEGDSVREKFFPVSDSGKLVPRTNNPFISVIENRLQTGVDRQPGIYLVSARPDLNLRGGPSTNFDIKGALVTGTQVHVIEFVDGENGVWALLDLEGDGVRDGFAYARFLVPAP